MTVGVASRLAVGLVFAFACEEPQSAERASATAAKAEVQGPIVATVDGEPVSLEDVRQTVEATGLSPADALARIETETLLADYARRAGYGGSKRDERSIDGARVRALLRMEVERGTAPEDMAAADIKARFESVRAQRERPEGRAVVHVLFRVDEPALDAKAKAGAQQLLSKVRLLSPEDAQAELSGFPAKSVRDGVTVVREKIEDARPDRDLAAPFVQAIFAVNAPQLIPEPVKTSFGYHVIYMQHVVPAIVLDFAEAERPIRQALSVEARRVRLEALIAKLKEARPVKYDEAAIAKALADDKVLGDGM